MPTNSNVNDGADDKVKDKVKDEMQPTRGVVAATEPGSNPAIG